MRLKVKAGITGFAQVYGRYNTPAIESTDGRLLHQKSIGTYGSASDSGNSESLFLKESSEGVVTESKTGKQSRKQSV